MNILINAVVPGAVSRAAVVPGGVSRATVKTAVLAAPASLHSATLGIVTLLAWVLTASLGAYMVTTWIARGGLRQQRAIRDGLPRIVVFGHMGLALTGLTVWITYLVSGLADLAWVAVGVLMVVIGLGVSMVTLWTPYPIARVVATGVIPASGPGETPPATGRLATPVPGVLTFSVTDEVLASALTDDVLAGKLVDDVLTQLLGDPAEATDTSRWRPTTLIPAGHGLAALTTFLLAVLTAVGTR